jgi:hypothetical protein
MAAGANADEYPTSPRSTYLRQRHRVLNDGARSPSSFLDTEAAVAIEAPT